MCGHKESFTPRPGGKFVYAARSGAYYQAECLGFGHVDGEKYPVMLVKESVSRKNEDIGFTGNDGQSIAHRPTFAGRFYDALEERTWSAMVYIKEGIGQPGLTGIFSGIGEQVHMGLYAGRLEFVTTGNEIKSVNYIPNTKKG